MTISTQAPTAQKRKRRTRTTTVSLRPALALSTLLPTHFDLLPGTEQLVCPDCGTWCFITGIQGGQPKLVPHHTERAGTPGARRCSGSNRLVDLDVTSEQRAEQLHEGIADAASRRPTTVLKKVKAPAPKAVLHIAQRRSDEPVGSDKQRAKRRTREWEAARVDVLVTDALRQHPLYGARSPLFSLTLPDGVPTEPPRKHRNRKGRLAA